MALVDLQDQDAERCSVFGRRLRSPKPWTQDKRFRMAQKFEIPIEPDVVQFLKSKQAWLQEENDQYVIRVNMHGVKQEDIQAGLIGRQLVVRAGTTLSTSESDIMSPISPNEVKEMSTVARVYGAMWLTNLAIYPPQQSQQELKTQQSHLFVESLQLPNDADTDNVQMFYNGTLLTFRVARKSLPSGPEEEEEEEEESENTTQLERQLDEKSKRAQLLRRELEDDEYEMEEVSRRLRAARGGGGGQRLRHGGGGSTRGAST
eukprot:2424775-Rhodomonas_salina.2